MFSEKNMTYSFETRDESFADVSFDTENAGASDVLETSLDAIAPEPNGFVKLGLAKELLQAVADMALPSPPLCSWPPSPRPCKRLTTPT